MQLLFVRHAVAEDRVLFAGSGKDDELRPLTAAGIKKMRKAARGLKQVLPALSFILSSPLRRAVQTADILAEHYASAHRAESRMLAPGGTLDAVCALARKYQTADAPIALVGHEPDLGEWASQLLSGRPVSFIPMKKGAIVLLETSAAPASGQATLQWALPPAQLRALGRKD